MKKIALLAAACVALVACKSNDPNNGSAEPDQVVFKKGQEVVLNVGTVSKAPARNITGKINKTNQNMDFVFNVGDQLKVDVYDGELQGSAFYTLEEGASTNVGRFRGVMPADGDAFMVTYGTEQSTQNFALNGVKKDAILAYNTGLFCTLPGNIELVVAPIIRLNLWSTNQRVTKIELQVREGYSLGETITLNCVNDKFPRGVRVGESAESATPFCIVLPYEYTNEYSNDLGLYVTVTAGVTDYSVEEYKLVNTDHKSYQFLKGEVANFAPKEIPADIYDDPDPSPAVDPEVNDGEVGINIMTNVYTEW